MHTKLTIPERLKDLRVSEKRMSLQELSDATGIPSSTLGNLFQRCRFHAL